MADEDPFLDTLSKRFGASFGNVDRTERKVQEHAATRTPTERARDRAEQKVLVNFNVTKSQRQQMKDLAQEMGLNVTQLLLHGVELVAKQRRGRA